MRNSLLSYLLVQTGAVDNFKTLQELAAWLEQHPEDAAAMNVAIQANADAIAAEVERATGAESALDKRVKAVEDDYLGWLIRQNLVMQLPTEATNREMLTRLLKLQSVP